MACSYIKTGAQLVATNMDETEFTSSNRDLLIPDVGSLIRVITDTTHSPVDDTIGKPSKFAFDVMTEEHGMISPAECVMLGDQIVTDIQFGINCNMTTVLTLTGITTPSMLEASVVKPSYVVENLMNIL